MSYASLIQIAMKLKGKPTRRGYIALCPAHNDKNPSLSLCELEGGKILFHCFAGCSQEAVRQELVRMNLWHEGGC